MTVLLKHTMKRGVGQDKYQGHARMLAKLKDNAGIRTSQSKLAIHTYISRKL